MVKLVAFTTAVTVVPLRMPGPLKRMPTSTPTVLGRVSVAEAFVVATPFRVVGPSPKPDPMVRSPCP